MSDALDTDKSVTTEDSTWRTLVLGMCHKRFPMRPPTTSRAIEMG